MNRTETPATTAEETLHPAPRAGRPGFALAVAMMAIIVIGALVAGAFFASNQEFRVGRNTLVEQRAFAVAEFGLNSEISNWDRSLNIPGRMAIGAVASRRIYVQQGDSAFVDITKLTNNTYWVVSTGVSSVGTPVSQAVRRTNALVRLAYPTISVGGAVQVAGDLDINGSARIDGRNTAPTAWDCSQIGGSDTAAIAVSTTARVTGADSTTTQGQPNIYTGSGDAFLTRSLTAADSNTYIRYGSETWNTLVRNADVRYTQCSAGICTVNLGQEIKPSLVATDSTKCDMANQYNWGEPRRSAVDSYTGLSSIGSGETYVGRCTSYFPIVYIPGNLSLNGNGRGQGILLVEGDFDIGGNFDFTGIIIVKDDINRGRGNSTVTGSIMARNADLGDNSSLNTIVGTQNVYYSKCAIENAVRGSAILVPTRERGWAQLF